MKLLSDRDYYVFDIEGAQLFLFSHLRPNYPSNLEPAVNKSPLLVITPE